METSPVEYQKSLELILSCKSYEEFETKVKEKSIKEKGNLYEAYAKVFFSARKQQYNIRTYYSRLYDEIPTTLGVNLSDVGTDAIILHNDGTVSLIQVKYRSNKNISLTRNIFGGMSLEGIGLGQKLKHLYLFSNTYTGPTNVGEQEKSRLKYILFHTLKEDWKLNCIYAKNFLAGRTGICIIKPQQLRPWQTEATEFVFKNGLNFGRRTIIAACGAGKTRLMYNIIDQGKYKSTLILVPTLHLLSQTFERFTTWIGNRVNFLLVGSDLDKNVIDCPYTLTTKTDIINKWFDKKSDKKYIVISTYQSLKTLLETNPVFDLVVADEAHWCAGKGEGTVVLNPEFPVENRLFLTATPKTYKGKNETVISMEDQEKFGPMYTYSFKRAIDDGVNCDYTVVIGHNLTEDIPEKTIEEVSEKDTNKSVDETENRDDPEFIAKFLSRSIRNLNLCSVLVCSPRHSINRKIYNEFLKINQTENLGIKSILMSEGESSKKKAEAIHTINSEEKVVIFQVRIFSLGTDIPRLNAVLIVGDRGSQIDIVQTCSRAMRIHPEKQMAYILVPYIVRNNFEEAGSYNNVRKIIRAIGSVDEAIFDTIVDRNNKSNQNTKRGRQIMFMGENWTEVEEEKTSFENFEIKMYDRFGTITEISNRIKAKILLEFIEEQNRFPKQKENYRGIKLGGFINNLKFTKDPEILKILSEHSKFNLLWVEWNNKLKPKILSLPEKIDIFLEYIKTTDQIPTRDIIYKDLKVRNFFDGLRRNRNKELLETMLKNHKFYTMWNSFKRRPPHNKSDRLVPFSRKEQLLLNFVKEYKRLPRSSEKYQEIIIGNFVAILKKGQKPEMLENILIDNNFRELWEAWKKTKENPNISPLERGEILLEFIEEKNRFPQNEEEYKGIKIDVFFRNLKRGRCKKILEGLLKNHNFNELWNTWKTTTKKRNNIIKPEERGKILLEYIKEKNEFPFQKQKYKGDNIGSFLNNLRMGMNKKVLDELLKNDKFKKLWSVWVLTRKTHKMKS